MCPNSKMLPSDSNNTERTKQTRMASTKVRDPANDAEPELPSHREARTQARRQQAAAAPANAVLPSSTLTTSASSLKRHSPSVDDVAGDGDDSIEVVEVVEGSSSAPAEGMDHVFLFSSFLICGRSRIIQVAASHLTINLP